MALAAVAAFSWLTPINDYGLENTYIAGNLFPVGAMVVLLLIVLVVNPILLKLAPRLTFKPFELGLIWSVIAIASGIPAAGLLRYFLPAATSLRYYATPENHWADYLLPHLKPWMTPLGDAASHTFYEGALGSAVPWEAWWASLGLWAVAAVQVFFAVMCLTVLLRRQWVERERFPFPLVQLPAEVSSRPEPGRLLNGFLRNPLVWAGALVPIVVHGVNALHLYYPGVPQLNLHYDLGSHLTQHPWNAARWGFVLHIWFMTIGFAYLLAQEIALSMAFFWLFELAQRVFFSGTNILTTGNDFRTLAAHESYGAVLALAGMVLWLARPHWREVWARVLGRRDAVDDEYEALSYRVALFGLLASMIGLVATFLQFGIGWAFSVAIVVVGLAMYVAAAWGSANAGLIMVQMRFEPADLLVSAFGSRAFTAPSLVNSALVENVFLYDLRETLMPSLMNSLKLADETGLRQPSVYRWGTIALIIAAGLAAWSWLSLVYDQGAAQLAPSTFVGHAQRVWRETMVRLEPGTERSMVNLFGAAFGGGLFLLLMFLRLQFVWWPLHPIGLVVLASWTAEMFGFSFLVGWVAKGVIVRLGGLRWYAMLRPFFLGLVLGDVIIAAVLTVVGFFYGQGYFVTPS